MKADFTASLDKFDEGLYLYHVKVPRQVYEKFAEQKIKRVVASYNGGDPIHNAFLSSGQANYYLKISKDTMKKQRLNVGDSLAVIVEEDTSKYGVPMPEEMEELLLQDPEGEAVFHALTAGKIRSLLFKVNGLKSVDKRIEKSIIILEHLKANDGKLDWKMLNEAWKMGLGEIQ